MSEGLSPSPEELSVKKNPIPEKRSPITPGERFSPYHELADIRQSPREDKPKLLREFKEKLVFQREGLAKIQAKVLETIRQDPDINAEKLADMVRTEGSQYGLAHWQEEFAERLTTRYAEIHSGIRQIREEYPEDKDLFTASFGSQPKGKVEIIEGPISLYFRCYNLDDYARIYTQKFLVDEDPSFIDRISASMSGGVSIGTSLLPELQGTVIAENVAGLFNRRSKESKWSQKVLVHEEQHAINRLLQQDFNSIKSLEEFWSAESKEEKEAALVRYLRNERKRAADERAKNEILAYFKEGYEPEKIVKTLTMKGGLYNYLDGEKKRLLDWSLDHLDLEGNEIMVRSIKKVFDEEYRSVLKLGTNTLKQLEKLGYDKEVIIAMFQRIPLGHWPKVMERMEESKKEIPAINKASTFNDLINAVKNIGVIKGSKESFTPEILVKTMLNIQSGQVPIESLTRSGGLREKVRELLAEEKSKH